MMTSRLLFNKNSVSCWVITEGMIGTENQCLAVVEALGLTPHIIHIKLKQPWKRLSPWLGLECSYTFEPKLSPPWPDLVIASGRKAIAAARYIKKQTNGKTITVFIQDPKISSQHFDLVAVPYHDCLRGSNVIITDGAPNRINERNLQSAKNKFSPLFQSMPSPKVAVLIGGNSRTHHLTSEIVQKTINQLSSLSASLMVTCSRRTGHDALTLFQNALNTKGNFFWDGTGDNPYLGMLAWADYIIVTSDSVSMLSDAASTGKPVYTIALAGGSPRFDRLHDHFKDLGITRPFTGKLENWSYTPLRDAQKIASSLEKIWDQL